MSNNNSNSNNRPTRTVKKYDLLFHTLVDGLNINRITKSKLKRLRPILPRRNLVKIVRLVIKREVDQSVSDKQYIKQFQKHIQGFERTISEHVQMELNRYFTSTNNLNRRRFIEENPDLIQSIRNVTNLINV